MRGGGGGGGSLHPAKSLSRSGFLQLVLISGVCTCSSSYRGYFYSRQTLIRWASSKPPVLRRLLTVSVWPLQVCVCVCVCVEHVELSLSYLVSAQAHTTFIIPEFPWPQWAFFFVWGWICVLWLALYLKNKTSETRLSNMPLYVFFFFLLLS